MGLKKASGKITTFYASNSKLFEPQSGYIYDTTKPFILYSFRLHKAQIRLLADAQ